MLISTSHACQQHSKRRSWPQASHQTCMSNLTAPVTTTGCKAVHAYLALLAASGLFNVVRSGRLIVGHTHEGRQIFLRQRPCLFNNARLQILTSDSQKSRLISTTRTQGHQGSLNRGAVQRFLVLPLVWNSSGWHVHIQQLRGWSCALTALSRIPKISDLGSTPQCRGKIQNGRGRHRHVT